jgi:uridine kinase
MACFVDPNCIDAIVMIERAGRRGLPVLVAIDGRSGAGKSTFGAALAAASNAPLIEGDAFYAGGLELRSDTAKQRAEACIDRPKLRGVLQQLKAGRAATYRPFDWEAFNGSLRSPAITVRPSNVVIVEGVYSCHPDLTDLVDVKILLTVPNALRQQRLVEREGSIGPWERQWHEAEEWYFAHLSMANHFDLIIE